MHSQDIKLLLHQAAAVEEDTADLYRRYAAAFPPHGEARQFFLLLSYEEKTQAQMLRLIEAHVPRDIDIAMPAIVHDAPRLLRQQRTLISEYISQLGSRPVDLLGALENALQLEAGEPKAAVDWLTGLPVADHVRQVVADLVDGGDAHQRRIIAFLRHWKQVWQHDVAREQSLHGADNASVSRPMAAGVVPEIASR